MTLIITELKRFGNERGIIMAADTAQTVECRTVDGLIEDRGFFGLTKLLPIPKLDAGLSYWGWARMPPSSKNGVWMDWWLRHFLAKNISDYNSIDGLAKLLEKELRKVIPPLDDKELETTEWKGNGGMHLAGFVNEGKEKIPCFWHIHNGKSEVSPEIDPHIVNANCDCSPKKYLELEGRGLITYQTVNGEIETYARIFRDNLAKNLANLREELGYVIPIPHMDFAADFLRAQIKFISELYAVGGIEDRGTIRQLARGIGGNVTTLTITKDGIHSYKEN